MGTWEFDLSKHSAGSSEMSQWLCQALCPLPLFQFPTPLPQPPSKCSGSLLIIRFHTAPSILGPNHCPLSLQVSYPYPARPWDSKLLHHRAVPSLLGSWAIFSCPPAIWSCLLSLPLHLSSPPLCRLLLFPLIPSSITNASSRNTLRVDWTNKWSRASRTTQVSASLEFH